MADGQEKKIGEVIAAAIEFLDATKDFAAVDEWRGGPASEKLRKARDRLNRALKASETEGEN